MKLPKIVIDTTAKWEGIRKLYFKPFGGSFKGGICFIFLAWYFEVVWND